MSYSTAEVRSGFLIIVSMVLLLVLTFAVGNFMGGETAYWNIQYKYLGGLETGAPVYYSGHEVGRVEDIQLVHGNTRPVLVTVQLPAEIALREDSQAYVDMLGMMGEKIVDLTPGSDGAALLPAGSTIQGSDPIPMHQMIGKMDLLADRMDEMTKSLNPLLDRVSSLTERHEEEIGKIIGNVHQISANVRDMTNDLKYRPWRLVRKGKVKDK